MACRFVCKAYTIIHYFGSEFRGGLIFFGLRGGLRVGTGFDPEGGYRVGTVSKKIFFKWP